MTQALPFGLEIPIIYVNPTVNADPGLICEVFRCGGLGFVDRYAAGGSVFPVPRGIAHGVRASTRELARLVSDPDVRLFMIPLEERGEIEAQSPGFLSQMEAPVLVEAGNAREAQIAERAGAAGLVARGNEGPGWVSEISGFVLLQQILGATSLPVFLRGGVGPFTAAGAIAAGATGIVLDVHLLLSTDSGVATSLKTFLRGLASPATVLFSEARESQCRVYGRPGTAAVRELRKFERGLAKNRDRYLLDEIDSALRKPVRSPDTDRALLALSEDIAIAAGMPAELESAQAIVNAMAQSMGADRSSKPIHENSPICVKHGTRFPFVQGPMAHISENIDFLAEVKRGGALPFLALGNMPASRAREKMKMAAAHIDGAYGVGLIGLEVNRKNYEAHLEVMVDERPPFAIVAGGDVQLARRVEALGSTCYLHCPTPGLLAQALRSGLRHFVWEGSESGGHIGPLGSLDLWNANLHELERAFREGVRADEVFALFAGGIGTARGRAFIEGMTSELTCRGLNIGLLMGTAYLATSEAVATGAITRTYQELVLSTQRTVVIGTTVNARARAANSPMASTLSERETLRLRDGAPIRERKALFEQDNLGALKLAAQGRACPQIGPGGECSESDEVPPSEQLKRGVYLMGQVASMFKERKSIEQLHEQLLHNGRPLLGSAVGWELRNPSTPGPIHPAGISEGSRGKMSPIEKIGRQAESPAYTRLSRQSLRKGPPASEPIALVGIGLLFPGSHGPEEFWRNIIQGTNSVTEVPDGRWDDRDFYCDPDPRAPGKTYSRIGGFVTDFTFDPLAYRVPPAVAEKMDRTQQMAVACVAAALEDAGLSADELPGKRVGVIIGNSMGGESTELYAVRVRLSRILARLEESLHKRGLTNDAAWLTSKSFLKDYLSQLPEITEDSLPGELANVISGRIANIFGFEGPNLTVDAACASSMAALNHACQELRRHAIDYAITGGVDSMMHPSSYIKFCKLGALSSVGSRPFDAFADGFVMGEGAGILVLKRLSDAIRDNDRIYCEVVGTGSSSDGRGKAITAPNADGQDRAVRSCYESSGVDVKTVGLIEAHGTSTAVGDAVELQVLDRLFRDARARACSVGIGSVKSQIGHLKAASGAAGMIKAALSLYHRTLPPTHNIETPSEAIDWADSPFYLVTEPKPWEEPPSGPRRAGVSAFGFGGTNFHVLLQESSASTRNALEEASRPTPIPRQDYGHPEASCACATEHAWLIGADSREELMAEVDRVLSRVVFAEVPISAPGYRRNAIHSKHRCGFIARNRHELAEKLRLVKEYSREDRDLRYLRSRGVHCVRGHAKKRGGVGFLFPGQGSQYADMLKELAGAFSQVRDTLREADEILTSLGVGPVTDRMWNDHSIPPVSARQHRSVIEDTGVVQPMILAADMAIFRLLKSMGIEPSACAGHSLGEYAACVATGVLSFRDALEVVSVRGREMSQVTLADPGRMLSVPADSRTVTAVIREVDGYVVVANENSPGQTIVSGHTEAVEAAAEILTKRGMAPVRLPVSAAFHSRVVLPAQGALKEALRRVDVKAPESPIFSNVTGEAYPADSEAADNIRDLLAEQMIAPVAWMKSLRNMYAQGIRMFVECGPKSVLTSLARDTLPDDALVVATNHPRKGESLQFMEAITFLAAEGVEVDQLSSGKIEESPDPERLSVPRESLDPWAHPTALDDMKTRYPLEDLMDDELHEIAAHCEFADFIKRQGDPIRALIKSSFQSFVQDFVPMKELVRHAQREGIDFQPIVINGVAAGLPSDIRFPFDRENLDELISGRNYIKKIQERVVSKILEKNIERLVKDNDGGAHFKPVNDYRDAIRLAACFDEVDLMGEYGLEKRVADSCDITSLFAMAAGLEALKDAGIPLMRGTRITAAGSELPDSWALPEPLRRDTGVIFVSCFPGLSSAIDEVTREQKSRYGDGAAKSLIEFYTGLVSRLHDQKERKAVTQWFATEFNRLEVGTEEDRYRFARDFTLKVMPMAHGLFARLIRAQGPNTHIHAGCAGTSQGILLARDWIRTGQARRVIVIAADDVASETLLPWVGSGFLAMGAATTESDVGRAAVPFGNRRSGVILGSAAVGLVVEKDSDVQERGMAPYASIEAGMTANSAFHSTRLDAEHISHVMGEVIGQWELRTGLSREQLTRDLVFMSHETYSPKRGGSAAAEITALRATFGPSAGKIPITNTKGFTGHTMAVGVEDVVALRSLQTGTLPSIANLKAPDPDFADMNLSSGGPTNVSHALRLAAGFGSQIVITLYKSRCNSEHRITDPSRRQLWLRSVTGYENPHEIEENRTLRVVNERLYSQPVEAPARHAPSPGPDPTPSAANHPCADDVKNKILSLLSARTGYPIDMLDPALDLEADLGIDTVKQAELLSDVREIFGLPRVEGLSVAEFPTIDHIVSFVAERASGAVESAESEPPEPLPEATTIVSRDIRLYEARLAPFDAHKTIPFPDVDRVIIAGGAQASADEVERALRSRGCERVDKQAHPALAQELIGSRVGVVNLFAAANDPSALNSTLHLLVSCASLFERGPCFFVTIVSQDGALGFESPHRNGYISGSVSGAMKSFAREYPQCKTVLLDVHPDLDWSQSASVAVESVCQEVPVELSLGFDGTRRAVFLAPVWGGGEEDPLPRDGVVVVTGGARGITSLCLRSLVKERPLRLVILGRTPLSAMTEPYDEFSAEDWEREKACIIEGMKREGLTPTPVRIEAELALRKSMGDVNRTIQDLKSMGSEAIYREVDVRDKTRVSAIVEEIKSLFGRIDVLIHAAGVEHSLPLTKKSVEEMESVISVKLHGMNNLLDAFMEQELIPGKIMGFGSLAGRFGNAAQVDYAAANDGLAHLLRWVNRAMKAKAWIVDWGPWSEVGMAMRGSARKVLEAAGIDFIPTDTGTEIFCHSLSRRTVSPELVAAGALGPFSGTAFGAPGPESELRTRFAGQPALIERLAPGEYLRASVTLDPTHTLLDHHRIDGVPVTPGVAGMEIMRQAAAVLDPDCMEACIKEIRFTRPIKLFNDKPLEVFVEVVRVGGRNGGHVRIDPKASGDDGFIARISSWHVDKSGRRIGSERVHQECAMEARGVEPQPLALQASPCEENVWLDSKSVYSVFFHGPGFRFLDRVSIFGGGKSVRFHFTDTAERGMMFGEVAPAIVEAVFQAAAAGGLELSGLLGLPTGIEECRFHRGLLEKGYVSSACGEVALRSDSDTSSGVPDRSTLVYDAIVRDAHGKTLLTLSGVEITPVLSGKGFPGAIYEEAVRVDELSAEIAGDSARLTGILCREELAYYETRTRVPKRAAEWLAGRVAAKRAVRRMIARGGGIAPQQKDIYVTQDEHGRPSARFTSDRAEKVADLSITHSNGLAIAAAALPGSCEGLGIDVEKVEPRSDHWMADHFTQWELSVAAESGDRDRYLTAMWSVKEATAKALGVGLAFEMRDFSVSHMDPSGRVQVELGNEASQYFKGRFSGAIEAFWEEWETMARARVTIK